MQNIVTHSLTNSNLSSWNEKPSNQVVIPLKNEINQEVIMELKVLVGNSANSPIYQVFEMKRKLPKFSQFCYIPNLK